MACWRRFLVSIPSSGSVVERLLDRQKQGVELRVATNSTHRRYTSPFPPLLRPIYTEDVPGVAAHDSLFVLLCPGVAVHERRITRRNKTKVLVQASFWTRNFRLRHNQRCDHSFQTRVVVLKWLGIFCEWLSFLLWLGTFCGGDIL